MILKYNGKVNKYYYKKNQDTGKDKKEQNKMGEDKFFYHERNSDFEVLGNSVENWK